MVCYGGQIDRTPCSSTASSSSSVCLCGSRAILCFLLVYSRQLLRSRGEAPPASLLCRQHGLLVGQSYYRTEAGFHRIAGSLGSQSGCCGIEQMHSSPASRSPTDTGYACGVTPGLLIACAHTGCTCHGQAGRTPPPGTMQLTPVHQRHLRCMPDYYNVGTVGRYSESLVRGRGLSGG